MLRVLGHATRCGSSGVNEDFAGTRGEYAWVIDGATGLGSAGLTGAPSDALWLAFTLHEALDAVVRAGDPGGPREALAAAARHVREAWSGGDLDVPPSAAVAVVRAAGGLLEVCAAADVEVALARGADVVRSVLDDRVERETAALLRRLSGLLADGVPHRAAMLEISPELIDVRRRRMNEPGGYVVVSSGAAPLEHARTAALEYRPGDRVLLATDGFSRIHRLYGRRDLWTAVLTGSVGLDAAIDELRRLDAATVEDPAHARWTARDDATALLLELA